MKNTPYTLFVKYMFYVNSLITIGYGIAWLISDQLQLWVCLLQAGFAMFCGLCHWHLESLKGKVK